MVTMLVTGNGVFNLVDEVRHAERCWSLLAWMLYDCNCGLNEVKVEFAEDERERKQEVVRR